MDKRWLSQLLDDSAFPLLVLALALTQIQLGPNKRANFLDRARHPAELRLNQRLHENTGEYKSSAPNESPQDAEKPVSNKHWVQH
jgi:hypothetical protein